MRVLSVRQGRFAGAIRLLFFRGIACAHCAVGVHTGQGGAPGMTQSRVGNMRDFKSFCHTYCKVIGFLQNFNQGEVFFIEKRLLGLIISWERVFESLKNVF